jgi:hypothetical protein
MNHSIALVVCQIFILNIKLAMYQLCAQDKRGSVEFTVTVVGRDEAYGTKSWIFLEFIGEGEVHLYERGC